MISNNLFTFVHHAKTKNNTFKIVSISLVIRNCISNFKNIKNSLQKLNVALRRLRQKDCYKFKATLGYRMRGTLYQKSWRRGQGSSMDKGTCCQTWWSEFDLKSTWWTERTNSFQLPSDLHMYTC